MDVDEIKALMAAMVASDLSEMEVEKDGWTLRLRRGAPDAATRRPAAEGAPALVPLPAPVAPAPAPRKPAKLASDGGVRSPLSGVVHFSPSPGAPAFVAVGRAVEAGDILCLVEAMKMFNEIRADRAGTVEALLVDAGADVDAGQPLLRIV